MGLIIPFVQCHLVSAFALEGKTTFRMHFSQCFTERNIMESSLLTLPASLLDIDNSSLVFFNQL